MEKSIFKNKVFYYFIIFYLITLFCWNSYAVIEGNIKGIIPIAVQMILLYLIFDKNKFTKKGIKIWSIILILGYGISLIGKLMKIFLGDEIVISELINKIIFLTVGILIYVFNEKYVEIVKTE